MTAIEACQGHVKPDVGFCELSLAGTAKVVSQLSGPICTGEVMLYLVQGLEELRRIFGVCGLGSREPSLVYA